jgi:hypothetical protein
MGFEVVRQLLDDIHHNSGHFGTICLSWRGDPLLHPEIEPILGHVLHMARRGLCDRIRIESSGVFLTPALVEMSTRGVPVEWVLDLDAGEGAGLDLLLPRAPRFGRVGLKRRATGELDPRADVRRFPSHEPRAGRYPNLSGTDFLWFSRLDHGNFQKNAKARSDLERVASLLHLPVESGDEEKPRRCRAPLLSPVISWDGKLTLCSADIQLENTVGSVVHHSFMEMWRGLDELRRETEAEGIPSRSHCGNCGFVWSPNAVR